MTLAAKFDFDGADGSTTLTDGATPANTGTCFGTTALSTTQPAQGSASLRLPGGAGNYATITGGTELLMDGDFTVTFRLRKDANGSSQTPFCLTDGSVYLSAIGSGDGFDWAVSGVTGLVGRGFTAPGEWVPVGIVRKGAKYKFFWYGFLAAMANGSSATIDMRSITLGRYAPNANQPFAGNIDKLQIDKGVALYDYSYNPDTLASTDATPTGRLISQALRRTAFSPEQAAGKIVSVNVAKDVYFGGKGRVSGTVKVKGAPNFPKYARVWLIDQRSGLLVREQWSNATTGAYSFDYLNLSLRYTVLTFDHTGAFRAVVADNLTADPMP